jgi:hypothetical protein
MDYDALVAQVRTLLQQEQRLAYRVLAPLQYPGDIIRLIIPSLWTLPAACSRPPCRAGCPLQTWPPRA